MQADFTKTIVNIYNGRHAQFVERIKHVMDERKLYVENNQYLQIDDPEVPVSVYPIFDKFLNQNCFLLAEQEVFDAILRMVPIQQSSQVRPRNIEELSAMLDESQSQIAFLSNELKQINEKYIELQNIKIEQFYNYALTGNIYLPDYVDRVVRNKAMDYSKRIIEYEYEKATETDTIEYKNKCTNTGICIGEEEDIYTVNDDAQTIIELSDMESILNALTSKDENSKKLASTDESAFSLSEPGVLHANLTAEETKEQAELENKVIQLAKQLSEISQKLQLEIKENKKVVSENNKLEQELTQLQDKVTGDADTTQFNAEPGSEEEKQESVVQITTNKDKLSLTVQEEKSGGKTVECQTTERVLENISLEFGGQLDSRQSGLTDASRPHTQNEGIMSSRVNEHLSEKYVECENESMQLQQDEIPGGKELNNSFDVSSIELSENEAIQFQDAELQTEEANISSECDGAQETDLPTVKQEDDGTETITSNEDKGSKCLSVLKQKDLLFSAIADNNNAEEDTVCAMEKCQVRESTIQTDTTANDIENLYEKMRNLKQQLRQLAEEKDAKSIYSNSDSKAVEVEELEELFNLMVQTDSPPLNEEECRDGSCQFDRDIYMEYLLEQYKEFEEKIGKSERNATQVGRKRIRSNSILNYARKQIKSEDSKEYFGRKNKKTSAEAVSASLKLALLKYSVNEEDKKIPEEREHIEQAISEERLIIEGIPDKNPLNYEEIEDKLVKSQVNYRIDEEREKLFLKPRNKIKSKAIYTNSEVSSQSATEDEIASGNSFENDLEAIKQVVKSEVIELRSRKEEHSSEQEAESSKYVQGIEQADYQNIHTVPRIAIFPGKQQEMRPFEYIPIKIDIKSDELKTRLKYKQQ